MICITIAQTSRTLALADMLNAVTLGADLIEIRLDTLEKSPHLKDMMEAKRVPILFSCRRLQDGGNWKGTEEERLILLRQAVLSSAEYVEIEMDIADQIRPFPGCKRVISYTNLQETPKNLDKIYQEMLALKPDIIKLTCRARTPDEAWPLIQILVKPPVPTTVVGLGKAGIMLSILGKKIHSLWTVAALERGMEAYPGQPTIQDLQNIYAYGDIGKSTRFTGVTGLGERDWLLTGLLNEGFRKVGVHHRVLPIQIGSPGMFRKTIDAVRLQSVVIDPSNYGSMHQIGQYDSASKYPVQASDFLLPEEDHWKASNLIGKTITNSLLRLIKHKEPDLEKPLQDRVVLFAGNGPLTRMAAREIKQQGAHLMFAGKDREEALRLSQVFGGRMLPWEAIYQTSHDILFYSPESLSEPEEDEMPIHPGYLRHGMYVLDLSNSPRMSRLLKEAMLRTCSFLHPVSFLVEYACTIIQETTGKQPDYQELMTKCQEWFMEEE